MTVITILPPRRERNGRKQRPTTKADIEAAQRAREEAEKATVLAQPHRRGNTDQRCENNAGRYMMHLQQHSSWQPQCQDAYDELRGIVRRWRNLKGLPDPETSRYREGGAGDVDEALLNRLHGRWQDAIHHVFNMAGDQEGTIVQSLCENYKAPPPHNERKAIRGLVSLARHFGML